MSRNLICPKCEEENLPEGEICWACYTPLTEESRRYYEGRPNEIEAVKRHNKAIERVKRQEHWRELRGVLPLCVFSSGVGLVGGAASLKKQRGWAMGLGILATLGPLLMLLLRFFKSAEPTSQEDTPPQRIADNVLHNAVHIGARQVRLVAGSIVFGYFLIGDEWHDQMRIPAYIWPELRAHLREVSDGWTRAIEIETEQGRFSFAGKIERHQELPVETLTLTRQN